MVHDPWLNNITLGYAIDRGLVMDEYFAGDKCNCAALSESECMCDADWTDPEIYELRAKVAELEARILDLDEYNQSAMDMVRDQAECIVELYDELKTAKRDGIISAVNGLTACVVPIELKSCAVYKAVDLIDYANSLTGEE